MQSVQATLYLYVMYYGKTFQNFGKPLGLQETEPINDKVTKPVSCSTNYIHTVY
jgi:hypothetical protein